MIGGYAISEKKFRKHLSLTNIEGRFEKMSIKKIVYIIGGCMGVGLGAIGAVVPMIPAFPFLLLAAFCFGRSSEKLNNWFINSNLNP